MQDFRKLKVWAFAHEFALSVYDATVRFPPTETYSLTSQLRRSATSIPSNIAEGCGRGSNADLARFLQIARGSASEADYQLQLAPDLRYIDQATHDALHSSIDEIQRMLSTLIFKIQRDGQTEQPGNRLNTQN